jgi:ATPase family protein associated with various cellular activities (AAA)
VTLFARRMNEGQVTVDNHTHSLPQPFMVIATQNPVEHHGTLAVPVFAHRCIVSTRYLSTRQKTEQAEAILEEILESVPVPL